MHHEEAIDEAKLMRSDRTVFVFRSRGGEWISSTNIPRVNLYYSVLPTGETYLNTHEDPSPIRIAPSAI